MLVRGELKLAGIAPASVPKDDPARDRANHADALPRTVPMRDAFVVRPNATAHVYEADSNSYRAITLPFGTRAIATPLRFGNVPTGIHDAQSGLYWLWTAPKANAAPQWVAVEGSDLGFASNRPEAFMTDHRDGSVTWRDRVTGAPTSYGAIMGRPFPDRIRFG